MDALPKELWSILLELLSSVHRMKLALTSRQWFIDVFELSDILDLSDAPPEAIDAYLRRIKDYMPSGVFPLRKLILSGELLDWREEELVALQNTRTNAVVDGENVKWILERSPMLTQVALPCMSEADLTSCLHLLFTLPKLDSLRLKRASFAHYQLLSERLQSTVTRLELHNTSCELDADWTQPCTLTFLESLTITEEFPPKYYTITLNENFLQDMSRLTELEFRRITMRGMIDVSHLKLTRLALLSERTGGFVFSSALQAANQLPQLKHFSMCATSLAGYPLQFMIGLTQLEYLDLRGFSYTPDKWRLLLANLQPSLRVLRVLECQANEQLREVVNQFPEGNKIHLIVEPLHEGIAYSYQ